MNFKKIAIPFIASLSLASTVMSITTLAEEPAPQTLSDEVNPTPGQ